MTDRKLIALVLTSQRLLAEMQALLERGRKLAGANSEIIKSARQARERKERPPYRHALPFGAQRSGSWGYV
jgi:hypothetical protein